MSSSTASRDSLAHDSNLGHRCSFLRNIAFITFSTCRQAHPSACYSILAKTHDGGGLTNPVGHNRTERTQVSFDVGAGLLLNGDVRRK